MITGERARAEKRQKNRQKRQRNMERGNMEGVEGEELVTSGFDTYVTSNWEQTCDR